MRLSPHLIRAWHLGNQDRHNRGNQEQNIPIPCLITRDINRSDKASPDQTNCHPGPSALSRGNNAKINQDQLEISCVLWTYAMVII